MSPSQLEREQAWASERSRTWRSLVDAVNARKAGNVPAVQAYLRGVEATRGRPVAEQCRDQIVACVAAESWETSSQWPGWGYRTRAPEPVYRKTKARRKK